MLGDLPAGAVFFYMGTAYVRCEGPAPAHMATHWKNAAGADVALALRVGSRPHEYQSFAANDVVVVRSRWAGHVEERVVFDLISR